MKNKQFSTHGVRYVEVDRESDGQRIDNFLLRELKGVPRTRIYRLLRKGEVRVNGGRAKPSQRVVAGDKIRIPPVRQGEPPNLAPAPGRLEQLRQQVIFENGDFLVINKSSGMAVHGGSGISLGVIEILRQDEKWAGLELAHRLDRSTSGCLVLAKKKSSLRWIHELLREGKVEKHYLALVRGQWQLGSKWIDAPLHTGTRRAGERHVTVDAKGKAARTRFVPQSFFHGATLMSVELATGRTHQIRVHAAHAEHPVAGDTRYGDVEFNQRMEKKRLKRLFLHAQALNFVSPSGEELLLSAPLPAELTRVMDRLKPKKG
ncbi:MAG: RluA family pseudouridine synthase [Gammaproteobacteria bacterium]|nr:RluA family pseudouridine synthase [Gammaproteobacteria bacterium]